MDDKVNKYRERREKRLKERLGARYDSVAEFHKRRNGRLVTRMDENPRLIFAIARNAGIDTVGKTMSEVLREVKKLEPSIMVYNEPKARMDAGKDDIDWITTENGAHIPLDDNKKAVAGPLKGNSFKKANTESGNGKKKSGSAKKSGSGSGLSKGSGFSDDWKPPAVKGMAEKEVHQTLAGCGKIGKQHYDKATQTAKDRHMLRTFTTHGMDHVQQVIEKTNQAADEIEKIQGNQHFQPGKIDRKLMMVSAYFHDTGMDGGDKDWGDDNGDGIRGNHGMNSAMHILEHSKEIEKLGVNPSQAAFIAFAHTKSKSGINDLMNPADWSVGLNRIDEAVKEYNERNPGKEIKFDRNAVFGGEPDEKNIQSMAAQVAALRLGDANREANISLRSQTGGKYEIEKMVKPEQCTSWQDEVDNSVISITNETGRHDLNDDNDKELGVLGQGNRNFSKRVVLGERNMVQVDTAYNEKHDTLQEEVTLRNGNDVPWCTVEALLERCGELNTINGVPRALKIKMSGLSGASKMSENAARAYETMWDRIRNDKDKKTGKKKFEGVAAVVLEFDDGTKIKFGGNNNRGNG